MDYLIVPYPDFRLGDVIDPDQFDANNEFVELKVNEMVDSINLFLSANGASKLGSTPKAPFTQANIQAYLDEFITYLNNSTGASYIGAVPGGDNPGTTIQAQLNYINTLLKGEFVKTASITNGAVTTPKIANQAVTNEKLGANSVTSDKITPGSVITAGLADASVTTAKIANQAVTPAKIQDYSIGNEKLLIDSIRTGNIASGAVNASKIADRAITGTKIGLREVKAENLDPALMEIVPITGINTRVGVLEDEMDVAQLELFNHDARLDTVESEIVKKGIWLGGLDNVIADLNEAPDGVVPYGTSTLNIPPGDGYGNVDTKTSRNTNYRIQVAYNDSGKPAYIRDKIITWGAWRMFGSEAPDNSITTYGRSGTITRIVSDVQVPGEGLYGNISIVMPKKAFSGTIEVKIQSQFANTNAGGGVNAVYQFGCSDTFIYTNERNILDVSSNFATEYTLSGLFDSGSNYIFALEKLNSNGRNAIRFEITFSGVGDVYGIANGTTFQQVTSNQPTTTPPLVKSAVSKSGDTMTGDLKIKKATANFTLENGIGNANHIIQLNANDVNNYGAQFKFGGADYLRVLGAQNVQFLGLDNQWTSLQDLKSSVSNGKLQIASAITGKGISTASDASFATMASNIGQLSSNKKASGSLSKNIDGGISITGLGFRPTCIIARSSGEYSTNGGAYFEGAVINGASNRTCYFTINNDGFTVYGTTFDMSNDIVWVAFS